VFTSFLGIGSMVANHVQRESNGFGQLATTSGPTADEV
jgi:hypothetical protein